MATSRVRKVGLSTPARGCRLPLGAPDDPRAALYGDKVVSIRPENLPASPVIAAFFLQNPAFSKWAMLDLNQRPPPCKGEKGRFWVLQAFAKPAYLSRFLFYGLLCVAPYCAPGGVRVVSSSGSVSAPTVPLFLAGPFADLPGS